MPYAVTSGDVSRICFRDAQAMLEPVTETTFVEALLYRYHARVPWRDLPERFGDFRVIHTRFSRWNNTGVCELVFQVLAQDTDNEYSIMDPTMISWQNKKFPGRNPSGRHCLLPDLMTRLR